MGVDVAQGFESDAEQQELVRGGEAYVGHVDVDGNAALAKGVDDRVEPGGPPVVRNLDRVDAVQQGAQARTVCRVALAKPLSR